MARDIKLPDIGDFKDVPIIEIHIKPGQTVAKEDVIFTLESDKATLDVPSPEAGVIGEIKVKVGDKVSQGALLATIEGSRRRRPRPPRRPLQSLPRRRLRPPLQPRPPLPRPLRRRRRPRPISNATLSCSAPGPAAIPPPFAPPISARRSSSSTEARRSAASASTSAAFRPRRCCTPPR